MRIPHYGHQQFNKGFGVGSTIHVYDPNSWGEDKELLPTLKDFDPHKSWTPWQLDRFADRILWDDIESGRDNHSDPYILMFEHLKARRKREIYVASGIPDSALMREGLSPDGQFIYWRTHPRGRKVNANFGKKGNKNGYYS